MPTKELSDDLDNCVIHFDRKVVVTSLLDKYGGLLEEIAKTVNEFLSAEEAKGKKFLKSFLLRGVKSDSKNEVITVVPEEKLQQQLEQLRDAHSMLYSAETVGGCKSLPTEFVPLKHVSIKLESLETKNAPAAATNGSAPVAIKEEKLPAKKTGALGTMFKKQEIAAAAKSPEKTTPKKVELEKKTGVLGAMFKKQETTTATKSSPKADQEKKSNTLGAMFKKQESIAVSKKSPETDKTTKSAAEQSRKPGTSSKREIKKKEDNEKPKPSVIKPPTPKKLNELFKKGDPKIPKEEPAANVSVNLFEESASSDDEEALDALKREILTDEDEEKPSTSSKRRRIVDSDDEDTGPEVKIERKEAEVEVLEIEDDKPQSSETFMDEEGFIVTVKAKPTTAVKKPNPTPVKLKKESPKTSAKNEAPNKTPAAKTKQGNIMNFFTKK